MTVPQKIVRYNPFLLVLMYSLFNANIFLAVQMVLHQGLSVQFEKPNLSCIITTQKYWTWNFLMKTSIGVEWGTSCKNKFLFVMIFSGFPDWSPSCFLVLHPTFERRTSLSMFSSVFWSSSWPVPRLSWESLRKPSGHCKIQILIIFIVVYFTCFRVLCTPERWSKSSLWMRLFFLLFNCFSSFNVWKEQKNVLHESSGTKCLVHELPWS